MEKEIEEVIKKVKELNGKELGHYIDKLLNEKDDKIMKNKEVLLTIAERINGFGYHHRAVRDKFKDMGLNMNAELEKLDNERTVKYIEDNPELLKMLEVAAEWWVNVIKKPFFANYDNKQISLEMKDYFQLDANEKKIAESNKKKLTPEKEKLFKDTLILVTADEIRKEGYCDLRADTYGFDTLAKALDKADLRVFFPKKLNMKVTTDYIELVSSRRFHDIVYEIPKNEDNKGKMM